MAPRIELYLSLVISVLVSAIDEPNTKCPQTCLSDNVTLVSKCSYNVSLRDNNKVVNVPICCNEDEQKSLQNYVNATLPEITLWYSDRCNKSLIELDFPYLGTYSLILRNNSLRKLKINIRPEHVKEIDLSTNQLKFITEGLFNNFTNLRKLNLSNNRMINIMEGSFNGLNKLESLDLSENNLTILSNVFTPLKNLQHLNLSRNNIEFIHENYFNNWLLQHLDVSHNNLKKVAPGALQLLPNLARLLLTDNPHLGIAQLDTQLLVGTGRRLQQIDASRTGLYQVPEAFTHSVRFLSLVGNRISSVSCGDLDSYPLLQSLDFSDNKIVSVEDDSLGRLEMLLLLNLNQNLITSVPKSLPDELNYLSINNNMISNLTTADFKGLPNLRILLLQSNKITYIQDHVFDDLLSLEMLDLSSNPIQALSSSTFNGPLSLRDLRLCYLNVSVPEQDGSFPMSSPESIQMLHLQASPSLARQLLADSAALAALSHLQYLDIRMNNLSEIRNDQLFYLGQLKTLRLHGNSFNCSAELWLRDWLSWNKSSSDNETCFYSSADAKVEEAKYNCTFSESFTINDSLPPVNLYSAEMINKLLRYYGYLNNKTDQTPYKNEKLSPKYNGTDVKGNKTSKVVKENNSVMDYGKREMKNTSWPDSDLKSKDFLSDKLPLKASKLLDTNRIQNDEISVDQRFLDVIVTPTKGAKKVFYEETSKSRRRLRSGKRLNTPTNVTMKENATNEVKEIKMTTIMLNESVTVGPFIGEAIKTEYSHYKATTSSAQYIVGTAAVSVLGVMSAILWAVFRTRYRRRAAAEPHDQIEVANISGGVLW